MKEEGWARGQHLLSGKRNCAIETSTRENKNIPALSQDEPQNRTGFRRQGLLMHSGESRRSFHEDLEEKCMEKGYLMKLLKGISRSLFQLQRNNIDVHPW